MSVSGSVTVTVQHNPRWFSTRLVMCVVWKGPCHKKRVEWTRERDRQISPSEQTPLILLLLNPSVDLLIFGWPTCDFRHEAWECSLHIYLTIRQAYSHAWTPIDLIFKMSTHAWLFGLILPRTPSFMDFFFFFCYLWCLSLDLWGKNVHLNNSV